LTETFEEEAMHEETMSGEEVTVADFRGRNHSEEACLGHGACGSAAKVTKVNQSK